MKKYRLISTVMVIMLFSSLLVMQGCMKQENPNLKTYQEYVQSLLDINYHGDFEMYEQISGSNNGEEVYNECIADVTSTLISRFAIEENMLSDDIMNRLNAVSKELCGKASYTVDEAVYSDKIYTVKVNIEPLNYFETAKEAFDTYIDDFNNRAAQGEFLEMSEEEYENQYAQGVVSLLEEALNECSYVEKTSYIVTILINESGESYVSDDELSEIGALIFPDYN